jgi:kynureninase
LALVAGFAPAAAFACAVDFARAAGFAFTVAGPDAVGFAFAPARSRRALRRCGRVLGRLPKTSRSPLPPPEESLEAMAMILPHRSS